MQIFHILPIVICYVLATTATSESLPLRFHHSQQRNFMIVAQDIDVDVDVDVDPGGGDFGGIQYGGGESFGEGEIPGSSAHSNLHGRPVTINHHQPQQVINPLIRQTSTASIGILFALLIWRGIAAYELADQFNSGFMKVVAVTPTVILLSANLAGLVVNLLKPLNFKNILKVILALNIVRESVELVYNALKIVLTSTSSIVPREVYFGRFFMNLWWLSLCITFSKSRWVLQLSPQQVHKTTHTHLNDDNRRYNTGAHNYR